jgi:hypothetical protein
MVNPYVRPPQFHHAFERSFLPFASNNPQCEPSQRTPPRRNSCSPGALIVDDQSVGQTAGACRADTGGQQEAVLLNEVGLPLPLVVGPVVDGWIVAHMHVVGGDGGAARLVVSNTFHTSVWPEVSESFTFFRMMSPSVS